MRLAGRKALLIAGIVAGAVALLLVLWGTRGAGRSGGAGDEGAGAARADRARAAARGLQGVSDQLQQRQRERERTGPSGEPIAVLEARLERFQSNLDLYREATRYPPDSRPIKEQPGQHRPHIVPPRRQPLVGPGGPSDKTLVILRQDQFYLAGSEAVTLTVECGTAEGPAPCEIVSATATAPGGTPRAEVPFSAEGGGEMHVAMFQPGAEGFASHYGPIQVLLTIRLAGETGTADFDLEYTPKPPAVFTRRVSEKLVKGSLVLGVELQVEKPGRYVIAGRVDDATGRSFGYVSFNDELPRGRAEAALTVFGKLILDEKAQAPFRLRDLEGFLLKEDTYPDRELMPTLMGAVHTTKAYRDHDFSADEWQSDERQRHLDELGRDVERAKSELDEARR
jgi:hypothetical protein